MTSAVFLLAVGLMVATGCGGGDATTSASTTISAEDYARQADELCRRVATEVTELDIQEKGQEILSGIASGRDGDGDEFTDAMQRYAGRASQSASIARDSELNFAICGASA